SLKPIDNDTILKSSKKTGRIITVEEHQIEGGLGGIIAEVLTGNGSFIFDRIGLFNTFVTDYGRHKDLLELYGLDANNIFKRTINLLSLHN
ncbi:MAG: transketolase, partial [Treponema sp.]|nr:transketolase [Treponema sp.]